MGISHPVCITCTAITNNRRCMKPTSFEHFKQLFKQRQAAHFITMFNPGDQTLSNQIICISHGLCGIKGLSSTSFGLLIHPFSAKLGTCIDTPQVLELNSSLLRGPITYIYLYIQKNKILIVSTGPISKIEIKSFFLLPKNTVILSMKYQCLQIVIFCETVIQSIFQGD